MTSRHWIIRVEGYPPVTTNELTLDEAAIIEEVSGIPYSIMNPLGSVKVAKGCVAVVARRSGMGDEAAVAYAGSAPLTVLHRAFEYVPDTDDEPTVDEGDDGGPPSSAPTSAGG